MQTWGVAWCLGGGERWGLRLRTHAGQALATAPCSVGSLGGLQAGYGGAAGPPTACSEHNDFTLGPVRVHWGRQASQSLSPWGLVACAHGGSGCCRPTTPNGAVPASVTSGAQGDTLVPRGGGCWPTGEGQRPVLLWKQQRPQGPSQGGWVRRARPASGEADQASAWTRRLSSILARAPAGRQAQAAALPAWAELGIPDPLLPWLRSYFSSICWVIDEISGGRM